MRLPDCMFAGVFFFAGTLLSCAARQPVHHQDPPQQNFWHDCQQTIPANPDGFFHFVCTDTKSRRWEILVRREGK
jgi:hypothetical protein